MISAYAVPDVVAAERAVMAELPDGELMARAVTGLAEVARVRLRERGAPRVVALVGPGNNGGDALYAVAALAADGFAAGALIHEGKAHPGALAAARDAGVVVESLAGPADPALAAGGSAYRLLSEAQVVLDGILGIGGRPGLPAWASGWVAAIPDDAYVIAVDLPSGQDPAGEQGDPDGVFADETVSFSLAKPVHLLPATQPACGLFTIADIGVPQPDSSAAVCRLDPADIAERWPVPGPLDDKYSRGVVGIVAGGEEYTGAAILSVTAAVCTGAGMVRYVGTPNPEWLVRAAVPEAVHGPGRVQAWVIGPGLDIHSRRAGAKAQLDCARTALASDLPVVLDAGGLDLLTGERAAPTLLTPHAGECARLLSRLTGDEIDRAAVTAHPLSHARRLADLTGAVVLLKGGTTLVVPPGADTAYSQDQAPAWLATAGAGDVLAGLLGTLVAAGLPLPEAGALGALVHGLAAERANPGGPIRALAVAHALPPTIAAALAVR
mgnify:FL=1